MSLRNEPREPTDNSTLDSSSYNWASWYGFVKQGAKAIHDANPSPLIFLSGLDFDTYLTPVVQKTALTPGTGVYSSADFPAAKMVLELHNYANSASDCASLESSLWTDGFQALNTSDASVNHFPVVMVSRSSLDGNGTLLYYLIATQ